MDDEINNNNQEQNNTFNITIVVVHNVSPNLTEQHIKEIFSHYGNIRDVYIAINEDTKVKKDYAFIEFENREDAEEAELYMSGGQIDGLIIKVEILDQNNCIGIKKKKIK